MSRYVAKSITNDAGRFGHVGLCQLHTKLKLKHPASVVIDSATYLLMISSPDVNNVAMSLYDITYLCVLFVPHTFTVLVWAALGLSSHLMP